MPLVGASGAIAAALGAYIVLFPGSRILSLVFLGFFYQLLEVPALVVLGYWFALQLLSGVTALGAETANGSVAFFAHIGGFLLGVIVGLILRVVGAGTARQVPRSTPLPARWDNPPMGRLVEMVIESVRVHMLSNRHVVILKDTENDRYLPIWIGAWEASAIAMRLQGLSAERPLTHDLFAAALDQLGVRVERVVISELADETYHARIDLERDGQHVEVDARPSDAIALAVRVEVSIFADEDVLAQAALAADPDEVIGEDGGVGRRGRARFEPARANPVPPAAARVDRQCPGRPAARDVPRLRELPRARSGRQPRRRRRRAALETASRMAGRGVGCASRRRAHSIGVRRAQRERHRPASPGSASRGEGSRGAAHRRRRSAQKSRTARKTTCGFAPVGLPAVRG